MIVAFRSSDKFVIVSDRQQGVGFAPVMCDEYRPSGLAEMAELPRKLRSPDENPRHSASHPPG